MAYTIVDLLEKFISIEKNAYKLYIEIAKDSNMNDRVKSIARILAKEEERHIQIYERLMQDMLTQSSIEVDFDIYDKASKLVSEFVSLNIVEKITDARKILEFALGFEKENLALALSIQGIMVRGENGAESKNYKAMSVIIEEEQKHIDNIEYFLK